MSRSNYLIKGDQRCSSKSQPGHSIYHLKAQSLDLINRLPDDCICDIFRSLDKPKDLQSCATVCWRWADLVLSLASELFKTEKSSLVLQGQDLDDTLLVSNVVDISSRNSVRDLRITRSSTGTAAGVGADGHLTDKGVQFAIKAFHNLTSVYLLGCQMITDEGIHHISTRCPMLSSLKIQDCSSITVASLEALMKQAESLRYLTLGQCPQIPSSAIVSFLILRPGLIDVRLQSMDDVLSQSAGSSEVATTAVSPPIAASKISHELRTLFLDDCAAGYLQELLAQITAHIQLPLLKCLVIRGSSGRSMNHHDLIRLLGPDTTLESLDLEAFRFSSYSDLMEVISLCQKTFAELRLVNCAFDSQPSFLTPPRPGIVQSCCKMITMMDLSWSSRGDDDDDTAADIVISSLGDNLRELVLDGWTRFTGYYREPLALRCRNLVRLSLRYTGVYDGVLRFMMSRKLPRLREIVLEGCRWITDEVFDVLFSSRLRKLKKVDVQGCPGVTVYAVVVHEVFWKIKH